MRTHTCPSRFIPALRMASQHEACISHLHIRMSCLCHPVCMLRMFVHESIVCVPAYLIHRCHSSLCCMHVCIRRHVHIYLHDCEHEICTCIWSIAFFGYAYKHEHMYIHTDVFIMVGMCVCICIIRRLRHACLYVCMHAVLLGCCIVERGMT